MGWWPLIVVPIVGALLVYAWTIVAVWWSGEP